MKIKKHKKIKLFGENITNTADLNHGIHGYPAKFPPQIPEKILQEFGHANYTIFDPFCGSGTTLVEAKFKNMDSIGNDINPIALLIADVKTTNYSESDLMYYSLIADNILNEYNACVGNESNYSSRINFHGKDHWFQKNVQFELELIIKHIDSCEIEKVKKLLNVTLSDIIVGVSNQESDTRYAAKQKNIKDGETITKFINKASLLKKKVNSFSQITSHNDSQVKIISNDARNLLDVSDESIDLIITSPPYANTYDYYLYHKHRMNWLGFNFKETQNSEIGSRHEYSSKKQSAQKWVVDLQQVIKEMFRVLKSDRYVFIVIGDSVIAQELIHIDKIVNDLSTEIGFQVINIESVPLSQNSRKFNKKFGTNQIKFEHLIQLYKP